MKRILLLLTCTFGVSCFARVELDSFESGVPKYWIVQGGGSLSTSPWHYKHGKNSLRWDFKAGTVIRINNTLGKFMEKTGPARRDYSGFAMSVYMPEAVKNASLQLEFRAGDKPGARSIEIPLNFKGWQTVNFVLNYKWQECFSSKPPENTDNILIRAPGNLSGTLFIDLVMYNTPMNKWASSVHSNHGVPRKIPWSGPTAEKVGAEMPEKVTENDKKALVRLERIMLPEFKITSRDRNSSNFRRILKNLKQFNVIEDSHGIRGMPVTSDRGETAPGTKSLRYICRDIYMLLISKNLQLSKNELSQIEKLAPAFFKHLDDQGFNPSRRAARNYFLKRVDAYAIYMLRDCLKKGGALKNASAFLQYSNHPLYGSVPQDRRLHMDYLQGYDIPCLIAMLEETEKEQVRALRFIAGNLDKAILTSNTESGFKPDGSGYHHHKLIYTYMQSALLTLSKIAYSFSGSSFALSKDTLSLLKKAALSACFYSNNSWLPLVMHGRMVFSYRKNKVSRNSHYARTLQLPEILKNLALAVGEANNVDKELAQAYVNLAPEDKAFAEKYQLHPGMPPQGNLSMPYGQLVAHRRDNWLALAYGYGKYTTSVEIYPGINRFGRYTANATLDIISDKGVNGSGSKVDGWDWNRMNGATVIYQSIDKLRPPHRGYFTIRNPYGFYGGISWRKSNGCFAMQIHGDVYDSSFRGKKTYFMFDERIYALGSNIQCANKQDPVQTNLFQKALETKDEALYVDGEKITTFPVADKALDIAKAHHLIDPVGNGYFVPAKQKLFYARKTQQSRDPVDKKDTSGDFATAWIDHGTAPKDAGYEYVVMPYCDQKSFDKFSASDYQVLQRDNKAHIVFDKASNSYGSIFFAAQNPTKMPHVQAVARNCMIISKKVNGELQLAVGDPDVNRERGKKGQYLGSKLNPLKVTFAGAWKLKAPVKGVKIISSGNDKTIIEFACIDGKSFDFTLIK